MKKLFSLLFFTLLYSVLAFNSLFSQFKDYKVKGGVSFAPLLTMSEHNLDRFSFLARGFFAYEVNRHFSLELGLGFGKYVTSDNFLPGGNGQKVSTDIVPIDIRGRIYPFKLKTINPYLYLGGGALFYQVTDVPNPNSPNIYYQHRQKDWTGIAEGGIGTEVKLDKSILFDVNAGVTYSFTDYLNNVVWGDWKDAYAHLGVGFTFTGKSGKEDSDKDGLTDDYEESIGTDPNNPDSDGDGLKDGEEVKKYYTNPMNKDSDGEGLNDYDEVIKYKTNPTNVDTDGEGLNDYDEVMKYGTDPNMKDTDLEGLNDYDEVMNYKTDPLKADTDGDGLTDYQEIEKYKTSPIKKDTDGGSVNDGDEVNRGTNPLDPSDDVEKKEEKIEVGQVIILEGINFETGSARITPDSEEILMKAYNTLKNNPDIVVEISGHTDSRGTYSRNMKLSKERADAVKDWLVSKGISADRIQTVGYGPDKPIAPNDTEQNMFKNRRIEFKRIK